MFFSHILYHVLGILLAYTDSTLKYAEEISLNVGVIEDQYHQFEITDIIHKEFDTLPNHSPNFGLSKSVFWFKIEVTNQVVDSVFLLKIQNANINSLTFYNMTNGKAEVQQLLSITPVYKREFKTQYPIFRVKLMPGSKAVFFLRASGNGIMEIPITIGRDATILEWVANDQLYFGIYSGIIIVMFLYNFFLYLSIKDKQYLYYVLYILVVGLTQACLQGYAAKFLWPDSEWLIIRANHVITVLAGVFSILFTFNFLHVKRFLRIVYIALCVTIGIYLISAILYLGGKYIIGQQILQLNTALSSALVLFSGFYIYYRKKYKPALFFYVAWSFFLSGVIIYILKDASILPYNSFTSNSILIGSGLEVALLSFALADKINIYKREKEESQLRTLQISKENERLIREQNLYLEQKVEERTHELKESNEILQQTLKHLKETQSQLVEAEKMASLGQLTAGVAHEINNPINFVTSNVAPLRRDINLLWEALIEIEKVGLSSDAIADKKQQLETYKEKLELEYLKTEIEFLLKGMHEGANRTAEIVKSLRIFSRVDEDSLKYADINEGLESTLVILNSVVKDALQVTKQYGDLPLVECYPGKLNQVFLNITTNAIYAINKKFEGESGGNLMIKTEADDTNVYIFIKDNGVGMPADIIEKIFEPFFTTKEVGEGTGLGMSIVYNTIKKHHGEIEIDSLVGEGTEFRLVIPLQQQIR
ncbi:sensor histidine kinase [Parapedobacter tibetensis]|uniref:sensor histidine kinase n=1 Tax=Parapedobacter tibetensis TaxID=2972951 RepID=UPI00214D55ED|nr:7TM diverse intracellular signaling domain-containing protein [Parapedobacter tibetensis]